MMNDSTLPYVSAMNRINFSIISAFAIENLSANELIAYLTGND